MGQLRQTAVNGSTLITRPFLQPRWCLTSQPAEAAPWELMCEYSLHSDHRCCCNFFQIQQWTVIISYIEVRLLLCCWLRSSCENHRWIHYLFFSNYRFTCFDDVFLVSLFTPSRLQTTAGKQICVKPSLPWVKRLVDELDQPSVWMNPQHLWSPQQNSHQVLPVLSDDSHLLH